MIRNYLITGAASGIGLEYTRRALQEGGKVVMTDINSQLGAEQQKQLRQEFGESRLMFVKLDVRSEAEWEQVWQEAEKWFDGPVDVLMNNAGLFSRTDWRLMLDVNLRGLLIGSMLAISKMGVTGGGRGGTVLNTASLAGLLTGGFQTATEEVYTATKQAVVGFTRSLDSNNSVWRKDKVRVMAVCPWVVDTALVRAAITDISPEERRRKETSWVHKLFPPSEVARAASLLVARGSPGDVVTVGPDRTVYLFPSLQKVVFLVCKMVHVLLTSSGLVGPDTLLSQRIISASAIFLLILTFLAMHFLLSLLGF